MASPKVYSHPELSEVPLASVLQALADPCRASIVRFLLQAPRREFACNEIPLDVSKATVSHHFEMLRSAGVIETRVDGTRCLSRVRVEEMNARFPGLLNLLVSETTSGPPLHP